ncbi:EAL domain-containing protein [Enterobacter quasiroggenkampii]|uniref:EAL domain-containing protein n=1 Tax=Enterobacter quasiroggenkampii TaxID=2497436 RepID=UPI001F1CC676|nr:EAL domain-containing protein [Enterobacter quasiroggenkampii]
MTTIKRHPTLLSGIRSLLTPYFYHVTARTLIDAIAQHQIVPVYQPFYDSQTGLMAGIEVLARWKHPLYGNVAPDTFIPLAEKHNLIAMLTHHLILQVINDLQHRIHLFPEGLYISLNLSPSNCLDPRFESDTVALLQKLATRHVQLIIEITEKHPLHVTPQLSEWFAALRRSPISIALDDFGTGYSNLAYIHALDPEYIKIDRLFVSQIGEHGDLRLMESLIELAKKMHLRIIAEGVETQHQADYLRLNGCDFLQGYYFCRPVQADELVRIVNLGERTTTPNTGWLQ